MSMPQVTYSDEDIQIVKVLNGHTSPETAYLVEDYPYGRLRCKIRFWLETAEKGQAKGQVRFARQTTNPKKAGEPWNKPHYSTYASFMLMYLDENDHVQYLTLHPYSDPKQVMAVRAVEEHLSKLDRATVKMIEQMGRKHYAVKWWQYDIEVGAIPADSPRPVQN